MPNIPIKHKKSNNSFTGNHGNTNIDEKMWLKHHSHFMWTFKDFVQDIKIPEIMSPACGKYPMLLLKC